LNSQNSIYNQHYLIVQDKSHVIPILSKMIMAFVLTLPILHMLMNGNLKKRRL